MQFYNPSTRAPTKLLGQNQGNKKKKKRQNPHDKDVIYSDTLIHLRLGPCVEEEEYIRGILVPKFSHSLSSLVPFRRNTPVWWRAFPFFSPPLPLCGAENVFYLYLCIWIAYAECQWLDGLSSPSEFISSIKLSNYLCMSCEGGYVMRAAESMPNSAT